MACLLQQMVRLSVASICFRLRHHGMKRNVDNFLLPASRSLGLMAANSQKAREQVPAILDVALTGRAT